MQIETIRADIKLKHRPHNGTQAYNLLIESLKAEIEEKQTILSELCTPDVKAQFIKDWKPAIRSVSVYDV